MATAQKRGFRFPWGSESGNGPDAHRSDDEPSLAERLGAIPDDLGHGPFDLNGNDPDDAPDAVEPLVAAESEAEPAPDAEPVDAVKPETTTEAPVADATAVANAPAEPAPVAEAATAPRSAWPESDRRSPNRAFSSPIAPAAEAAPKTTQKANPLVTGLVRAMRDAAKVARDEAVTGLRADAAARAEAIQTDAAAAVAGLRKTADADVAAIRDWSKAEMTRVREETESRIAARKEQLVAETDDHAAATERTLADLGSAVKAYETEAATFFDALLAEDDPARLAGLAERMPSPPALDGFAAAAPTPTAEPRPKRTPKVAEPEPEPGPEMAAEPEIVAEPEMVAEPEAAASEPALAPEVPDVLDAEAAAAAEAESLAGLDGQTQVIVSGLTSVASIAAFKSGLMRTHGVSAVSVNAGADGDCLFTVTHAGDTDVRLAVRELDPFQTRLIADDGATLVVVAHEPAA